MGDTTVNVEAEKAPVVAVVHRPHKSRMQIAWEIVEKWLFSTKFAVVALALFYIRGDHWADYKCLVGMTDPAQINGFVQLTGNKNQTTQNIILGFLGFGTVAGIGASVVNRFTQTTTQRVNPDRNHNSRADRED